MPDTAETALEGTSASELRRLDARATDYRFTLDDVPWDQLDQPGALAGPTLRRLLDHDALDGARIAVAFASLERDLVAFLEAERADGPEESEQAGARSVALLLEEEVRHAALFDRLAAHFGATGQAPPDTFRRLRLVEDKVVRRHLFWLHCLFFEELTVWIHDALARDSGIQPTWLAAHRLHAREETQHVLTDAAQLAASPVDEALRERLSRAFVLYIDEHVDAFFGIDAADGRGRRLRDLPLFDEVLTHRAFRRTRAVAPYLASLRARREGRLSGPALPPSHDTLPAALERSAASARGISFLGRGIATLSYAQLYERAVGTLGGLQGQGLRPGDPVVVVCGQPATAVEALWACLLGGLVPALVPLPSGGRDSESHRRLLRVAAQLDAPLLTDQQGPVGDATELGRKVLRLADLGGGAPGAVHRAQPDDLALLQYSSGSLGQPRGVRLTHRQVLSNVAGMTAARGRPDDRFASWLPLSHDMGLVGFHLAPVATGSDQLLAAPRTWLRSPATWLRALSEFGATVTGLPASALPALLAEPFDADLSSLHTVLVGAEPIDARVLRAVAERLAPLGLAPGALCPAYGLAEATLAVTMHAGPPASLRVERESVQPGSRVVPAGPADEDYLEVVRVGAPIAGMSVRVGGRPGEVGEILVTGPSVADGYQGSAERWSELATGDLGFVWEGGLYVCGRSKETFEVNGQTFHAHDVERVAQEVPGVRAAALGLGEERVLFVVPVGARSGAGGLPDLVRRHLRLRLDLEPDRIVLASASELLRTTSGKLRRTALLPAWQERRLAEEILLVRRTWAEVLGLPLAEVGPDDDFRELGGSSIRALEVHARLEEALDRELGHEVLDGTTPRELARRLAQSAREAQPQRVIWALASPAFADPLCEKGAPAGCAFSLCGVGEGSRAKQNNLAQEGPLAAHPGLGARPLPAPAKRAVERAAQADDALVIVALAVRFPGASTPGALWEMLRDGESAVRAVDRWDTAGLSSGRGALFDLAGVQAFDPDAFGLRLEEARAMDPQHRLALELAAEALQQAPPDTPRVGVYLACGDFEGEHAADGQDAARRAPATIGPHTLLGSLKNMVAGRVAGALGLTGPALAVDTACSSSLVAVHLAARAVRAGECDLALAGGVQLLLTPQGFRAFDAAGLLSSTGESQPFDRAAAGLVPGEGGGVVAITTLSRARRLGHAVLARLLGSAVTNDGGGLSSTAPSPDGQEAAIRAAWADARLDPSDAGYLEAHAAGTAIGDAVEATASARVFGTVPVASVKGNLGHTLATAGVAGLARALLSIEHRWLPPSAGLRQPTGRVDWAASGLVPLVEGRAWTGRRLAGVSSFGLGGTNAHVVIDGVEADPPAPVGDHRPRRLRAVLDPLCPARPTLALVLAGPGGQHPGMARALRDAVPGFAALLDACAAQAGGAAGSDAAAAVLGAFDDARCLDIAHAQLTTFALTWALGRWLLDLGLEPAVVLGHSGGELAAAVLAGVLTLEEGWALARERGRLMARVPGGLMAVLGQLDEIPAGTWISARNAPGQVVLAGTRAALDRAAEVLGPDRVRHLAVTCPAHSPLLEAEAADYLRLAASLPAREAGIPLLSTRTGAPLVPSAAHWRDQLLGPVEFEATVRAARALGATVFVDAGPSSGLGAAIRSTLPDADVISLLTRTDGSMAPTLRGLEALVASGALPRLAGLRAAPLHFQRRPLTARPTAGDHVVQGVATRAAAELYDLAMQLAGTTSLERAIVLRPCPAGAHLERVDLPDPSEADRGGGQALVADGVTVLTFRRGGAAQADAPAAVDLPAIRARCTTLGSPRRVRETLAASGMVLGPQLWALRALLLGDDELLAEVVLPAGAATGALVDPALLDSASQAAAALGARDVTWVGFAVERLVVHAPAHGACLAWLRVQRRTPDLVVVDLALIDADGRPLVTVDGMSARPAKPAERAPARPPPPPAERPQAGLASPVRRLIARRLGRDPASLHPHTPFSQLGVDSLTAVELSAMLEALLGRRLPVTLLFECPDLAALEERLADDRR